MSEYTTTDIAPHTHEPSKFIIPKARGNNPVKKLDSRSQVLFIGGDGWDRLSQLFFTFQARNGMFTNTAAPTAGTHQSRSRRRNLQHGTSAIGT
ncbi:MAG: hypothetical protein ACKOCE_06120, partial [Acidimicrobiia bacterium]